MDLPGGRELGAWRVGAFQNFPAEDVGDLGVRRSGITVVDDVDWPVRPRGIGFLMITVDLFGAPADGVADVTAPAELGVDQAFLLEHAQSVLDGGAGHPEPITQHVGRGQALAGAVLTVQDRVPQGLGGLEVRRPGVLVQGQGHAPTVSPASRSDTDTSPGSPPDRLPT